MTESHALNADSLQMNWMRTILDEIDYGIVLCSDAGVVCSNRAAREQLDAKHFPLRIRDAEAGAVDPADNAALRAALVDALARQRRRLVTLRGGERPMPVAVVPLGLGAGPGASLAMIVMGRDRLCPQLTKNWFCSQHQLTPAESDVLGDLLEGHDPRAIATRNGVALCTVRTQIARIKEKTSLHGIRDLVMAAATLPPMVPRVYVAA